MMSSCCTDPVRIVQYHISLLDDTTVDFELKSSAKGGLLYEQVCSHVRLTDHMYFGLRYIADTKQSYWLDFDKPLVSQLKGEGPFTLFFGVKFYVADPCKLHDELTRYLFFLQTKQDVRQGRLPVSFDDAAELGALAVQSEFGDYDSRRHDRSYVKEFKFVPNQTPDLEERIAAIHKSLTGKIPAAVEYMFLEKVKWLDMYGVDMHSVLGESGVEYFIGLTPTGIVVYKGKNKVGSYFWPRITKVNSKSKLFTIRVRDKNNDENLYAFEVATKDACRHLYRCTIEHHAFFRLNQAADTGRTSTVNTPRQFHRVGAGGGANATKGTAAAVGGTSATNGGARTNTIEGTGVNGGPDTLSISSRTSAGSRVYRHSASNIYRRNNLPTGSSAVGGGTGTTSTSNLNDLNRDTSVAPNATDGSGTAGGGGIIGTPAGRPVTPSFEQPATEDSILHTTNAASAATGRISPPTEAFSSGRYSVTGSTAGGGGGGAPITTDGERAATATDANYNVDNQANIESGDARTQTGTTSDATAGGQGGVAPWESQRDRGFYTSGRDSPQSVRSDRLKFPRRIPSTSEISDGGYSYQHRQQHRYGLIPKGGHYARPQRVYDPSTMTRRGAEKNC